MNPQFINIIRQQVKRMLSDQRPKTFSHHVYDSPAEKGKANFEFLRDAVFIILGILSAGFGLKGFLLPNGFIDGGITGISLLIHLETTVPLAGLLILINIPFVLLGWKQISVVFGVKSIIAISLLALVVATLPYPVITNDKLLVSVFGGFFLGAGIGLTIRGGGAIDGTEILAIFLNRKSSLSVGDFILLFNIGIFSTAAYFLSVETALYSILIYLAASKTVDFILEGIEEFTGVTVVSPRNAEIAEMIRNKLNRGLTVYSGKRGYGKTGENYPTEIVYTVITRLEINRLRSEIKKIDPSAFVVLQSVRDIHGGKIKKRSFN